MCAVIFFKLTQMLFICHPECIPDGILLVGMGKYTNHINLFFSLFRYLFLS